MRAELSMSPLCQLGLVTAVSKSTAIQKRQIDIQVTRMRLFDLICLRHPLTFAPVTFWVAESWSHLVARLRGGRGGGRGDVINAKSGMTSTKNWKLHPVSLPLYRSDSEGNGKWFILLCRLVVKCSLFLPMSCDWTGSWHFLRAYAFYQPPAFSRKLHGVSNRQNRMCQSGKGARKAMNWLCSPVLRRRRIASPSGLCISFTFWELSSFQSRIFLLKSSFFRNLVPF